SKELIPPRVEGEPEIPLAGAGEKPPSRHHLEAEKQLLAARKEHVARVRECVNLLRDTVALGTPAREILAKDAEIALLDREIALELKRRKLEQLKAAPIDAPLPEETEEREEPAEPVASQE